MGMNKISNYTDITNTNSLLFSVEKQRQDFIAISLTEFDNSVVPRITSGSTVNIDGALFEADSDILIDGTPSDGAVWVKLVGQSTGPNPEDYIAVPTWSNVTPVWDESKQGFYENGNERVVAGCTKSGASYTNKFMLERIEDFRVRRYGNGNVEILNNITGVNSTFSTSNFGTSTITNLNATNAVIGSTQFNPRLNFTHNRWRLKIPAFVGIGGLGDIRDDGFWLYLAATSSNSSNLGTLLPGIYVSGTGPVSIYSCYGKSGAVIGDIVDFL